MHPHRSRGRSDRASTSAGSSHMVGYFTDISKPGAAPRLRGAGLYSQHFQYGYRGRVTFFAAKCWIWFRSCGCGQRPLSCVRTKCRARTGAFEFRLGGPQPARRAGHDARSSFSPREFQCFGFEPPTQRISCLRVRDRPLVPGTKKIHPICLWIFQGIQRLTTQMT